MALPPTPSAGDWAREIRDAVAEEWTGEISVVAPGSPGSWTPGSGVTGATEGETVLSRRPARIQPINSPTETSDGNGWETKQRVLVQCDILDGDPHLVKGLIVKVHDGGRDAQQLTGANLQLMSPINSSHAAVRTLRCILELSA